MTKRIYALSIIILLMFTSCMPIRSYVTGNVTVEKTENTGSNFVTCTPESRQGDVCIESYDPVCGEKQAGEKKTFSNSCFACLDKAIKGYSSGECQETNSTHTL